MRRRYQDFDWLRIKLEESQPTHLIPVGTKPELLIIEYFLSALKIVPPGFSAAMGIARDIVINRTVKN